MGRLLRSPSSATQIPMRVTSYTYQDSPANGKVRIIVVAELEPATTGAVDVAIGHRVEQGAGRSRADDRVKARPPGELVHGQAMPCRPH